jgi:hypothetical protein
MDNCPRRQAGAYARHADEMNTLPPGEFAVVFASIGEFCTP